MQKNFIFSDTETTGLREKDFIQIIQSASILTDESFERIDAQNIERPLPWVVPQPGAYLVHKKDFKSRFKYISLSNDERYL